MLYDYIYIYIYIYIGMIYNIALLYTQQVQPQYASALLREVAWSNVFAVFQEARRTFTWRTSSAPCWWWVAPPSRSRMCLAATLWPLLVSTSTSWSQEPSPPWRLTPGRGPGGQGASPGVFWRFGMGFLEDGHWDLEAVGSRKTDRMPITSLTWSVSASRSGCTDKMLLGLLGGGSSLPVFPSA